jgi:cytochrome d ubiquinol oxidase subunit I
MGVVSGIVMSYQFGTNWSRFSDIAGPVLGAPMAYEVLSAFFLEAGFLGIMLFGREKVGPTLHMLAVVMVALGTAFSAFWILSVNSWMHTPAGFSVDEASGQFVPEDWWAIIFNPSFPYRFAHTVTAAYLTTAFIVGGVGAWHLLKDRANQGARVMFSMAMWMAAIVAPLQLVLGHEHGVNTLEHQPVKVMAMEGHYDSYPGGAPLYLFGLPNEETQHLDYAIGIPFVGSTILKGNPFADVEGLDTVPDADQPPVPIVFWSFRVMVGLGMLMIGIGAWSLWARWKGVLYSDRRLLRAAVAMAPSGLVAVLAGWITTEVGRQPFTVYGLLRTADSVAPLSADAVGTSLVAFVVVYFIVFGAGFAYLVSLMRRTPHQGESGEGPEGPIRTAGLTPAPSLPRGEQEATA